MLRIRDVFPGSEFSISDPGSKRFRILNPAPHKRIEVFLTQKLVSKALGNMIRDVHLGSRMGILNFYPSWIQGSKRHRIPDPVPQHCKNDTHKINKQVRDVNPTFRLVILDPDP